MIKTRLLNSEIWKNISNLGHFDTFCICDAGLPIDKDIKKIDIAIELGKPSFIEVLDVILEMVKIQKVTLAKEIESKNKDIFEKCLKILSKNKVPKTDFVTHEEFKKQSKKCLFIVRTGENTPYANIILESDVTF